MQRASLAENATETNRELAGSADRMRPGLDGKSTTTVAATCPRAQETLREQLDLTEAILQTTSALVVVLNPKGRIVRFNRACERTTGYSFDEVRGRCFWSMLLIPEEVERVKAVFGDLRAGHFPNN